MAPVENPGLSPGARVGWRARLRRFDVLFPLLFAIGYAWLSLYALPDYGLTWDESWENYYGDKSLNFYFGFDRAHLDMGADTVAIHQRPDHPNFYDLSTSFRDSDVVRHPELIWPLGPMLASACKYVCFAWLRLFDPIDAHHVAPVLAVTALLPLLYWFTRRHWGRWPAVVAVVVLAAYPRFWAEAHVNVKDTLSAVLFAAVLMLFATALEWGCWRLLLGVGVLGGLALATKANAMFLPVVILPWLGLELWRRRRAGVGGPGRGWWLALGGAVALAVLVMLVCWPLLWLDFPASLATYARSLAARGYGGGAASGWSGEPLRNALATMPLAVLVLALTGLGRVVVQRAARRPAVTALVLLWLIVPVLRVSVPGARDFDVIRHWLEFVPALAIVAGLGAGWLAAGVQMLAQRWRLAPAWGLAASVGLVALLLQGVIRWDVRVHPNQLVYYSPLVGRLAGAQARGWPDATDYWGNSYRQGLDWLNANVAAQEPVLIVGVAEHIVFAAHQLALDRRIRLEPRAKLTPAALAACDRPVYLMYITRSAWYPAAVREHDARLTPVFAVAVDGGVILKILRLK